MSQINTRMDGNKQDFKAHASSDIHENARLDSWRSSPTNGHMRRRRRMHVHLALAEQDAIGWDQFFKGLLSNE